jgi:osmotically-inducible protein OsmY
MAPQRVQANANQRIVQLPGRQGLQNVRVDVIGRTAVIEGTATSDRDRRMAELLMRLEPGVSSVQNNVRVNAR